MRTIKDLTKDAIRAFLFGLASGAAILVVAALFGAIYGGLGSALEASRGAVLLVGGFTLLFSGILMLKSGNLPPEVFKLRLSKKDSETSEDMGEPVIQFRKLPRQYAFAIVAVGILTTSLVPECIILYIL